MSLRATILLLSIPFLTPSVTAIAIASHDQAGSSLVPGYTGPPDQTLTGDFLTNTFCYCAPEKPGGNASHYYQIDYFNIHLQSTFILQQTCLSGHNCAPCRQQPTLRLERTCDLSRNRDCTGFAKECLPANLSSTLLAGTNQRHWGRKWFRLSWAGIWHGRLHDHLIYWPNWHSFWKDAIEFNGHLRDLSPEGGQGYRLEGKEEAEKVCEGKCWEQVGSGVLRVEGVVLSHQVSYGDVDDMCNGLRGILIYAGVANAIVRSDIRDLLLTLCKARHQVSHTQVMKFLYLGPMASWKNVRILRTVLVHYLLMVQSHSSPLQATDISSAFLGLSHPINTTAFTVPAAPRGFRVDCRFDPSKPLNVLAIYLSAIECMYHFAQKGWDTELTGGIKLWARGFTVEVNIVTSQGAHSGLPLLTSHIVLALYRTIEELSRSKRFCKVVADISLGGRQLGWLDIQTLTLEAASVGTASNNGAANATLRDFSRVAATYPSGQVTDVDDPRFTIDYAYSGARIDSQDIFIAVLDGLATSAQYSDIAPCKHLSAMSVSGKCEIGIDDVDGRHQINYSFVTKALMVVLWNVILTLRRFGEMTFVVKWEGVDVGKGYIRERGGLANDGPSEIARRDFNPAGNQNPGD